MATHSLFLTFSWFSWQLDGHQIKNTTLMRRRCFISYFFHTNSGNRLWEIFKHFDIVVENDFYSLVNYFYWNCLYDCRNVLSTKKWLVLITCLIVLIENQILSSFFSKGGGGDGGGGGGGGGRDFWNLEPSFQQRSVWFFITSLILLITNQILTSLVGKKKGVCDFFFKFSNFLSTKKLLV